MIMNTELLKKKFNKIGADVTFLERSSSVGVSDNSIAVTVDVRSNKKEKEYYEVRYDPSIDFSLSVIDLQPKDRHLLLMLKQANLGEKLKILCGHDERHYFSCGIPENAGVSTVTEAKHALLPPEVIQAHKKKKGKNKDLLKRKNETSVRQGEWLFVGDEGFDPDNPKMIKRDEPLSRGQGSKPHVCEELYSFGGETVYVHPKYAPNGITEGKMSAVRKEMQADGVWKMDFDVRTKDATVYARGYVRHPDHKTIHLPFWHRVYMNTENKSKASKVSVFLD